MNLNIPYPDSIPNFLKIDANFSLLPFNNLRLKVKYTDNTDEEYIRSDDTLTVNFTFYVFDKNRQCINQTTKIFDFNNDNVYLKDLFPQQYLNQDGTFNFNDYYFLVSVVENIEELIFPNQ